MSVSKLTYEQYSTSLSYLTEYNNIIGPLFGSQTNIKEEIVFVNIQF